MKKQNSKVNTLHEREEFSLLIKQIIKMIDEGSENSISNIMYRISWNDTIYRTFNEGVRLSWKYGYQGNLPASLIDYIHETHMSFIVMALRKLYEKKQKGKWSVNSIPTIYDKIAKSANLFTRENFVCRDDNPYEEYPETNADSWKTNAIVRHRHKIFDKLCCIDVPENRSRDDRLLIRIIEQLKKGNKLNNDIEIFSNKFLAHASSENNRPNEEVVYSSISLNKIQNQIKRSIWGIQQIGKLIDHLVLTTVAMPQFDPIQNWCKSIFSDEIELKLSKYWRKRMAWWEQWFNYYWMGEDLYISPRKSI